MKSFAAVVTITLSCLSKPAQAWISTTTTTTTTIGAVIPGRSSVLLHSTAIKSDDILGGVSEFDKWFSSISGADCRSTIRHEAFGNLRGLTSTTGKDGGELMKVPRSVVLEADFNSPDWDAQLAEKLWKECSTFASSPLSGYCSLLTRGWVPNDSTDVPPNTAEDALRHWTDQQKSLLTTKPAGQRILELQEKQEAQWRKKFESIKGMTWEQFEWAMEVVHSRAFCGEFGIGGSALPPAISAAAPLIAAVAGWVYYFQVHGDEDVVLLGLAAVAALPTIFNLVNQSPPVAVLLPLIDSANHREEADSKIDYSPLSDSFTLSAGSNCFVEEGGKKQLYISYGKKADTELLLNYGFLEGVELKGKDVNTDRQALAEAFLARN